MTQSISIQPGDMHRFKVDWASDWRVMVNQHVETPILSSGAADFTGQFEGQDLDSILDGNGATGVETSSVEDVYFPAINPANKTDEVSGVYFKWLYGNEPESVILIRRETPGGTPIRVGEGSPRGFSFDPIIKGQWYSALVLSAGEVRFWRLEEMRLLGIGDPVQRLAGIESEVRVFKEAGDVAVTNISGEVLDCFVDVR